MTTQTRVDPPRPIDPLAPGPRGRYEDDVVVVERDADVHRRLRLGRTRTRHFDVGRHGDRLHVLHHLAREQVDNDLTGLLVSELFAPGWLSGSDTFERVFTGVVRSSCPEPLDGWELFYRNTLRRLGEPAPARDVSDDGSIDGYRPVYQRALELVPGGTVLELGCCFGFLALQLAERGDADVVASDVAAGTVTLLRTVAARLGLRVRTLVADAARVPLPDASTDTVLAVHLLEHLDQSNGAQVLGEALRLARRRVVVAVPFEPEPTRAYGHVRTFDVASLTALTHELPAGWRSRVEVHHGGWLVVDRV